MKTKLFTNKNHQFIQAGIGYYARVICSNCGVSISKKHAPCFSLKQEKVLKISDNESLIVWDDLGRQETEKYLTGGYHD